MKAWPRSWSLQAEITSIAESKITKGCSECTAAQRQKPTKQKMFLKGTCPQPSLAEGNFTLGSYVSMLWMWAGGKSTQLLSPLNIHLSFSSDTTAPTHGLAAQGCARCQHWPGCQEHSLQKGFLRLQRALWRRNNLLSLMLLSDLREQS